MGLIYNKIKTREVQNWFGSLSNISEQCFKTDRFIQIEYQGHVIQRWLFYNKLILNSKLIHIFSYISFFPRNCLLLMFNHRKWLNKFTFLSTLRNCNSFCKHSSDIVGFSICVIFLLFNLEYLYLTFITPNYVKTK